MENNQKPAYPTNGRMHSDMTGLTKREYFAAMALQGLTNEFWNEHLQDVAEKAGSNISKIIAISAVDIADELIKELERDGK